MRISTPKRGYYWLWVTCLLGVDYFSTLAYQPSMTYQLAGRLGPLATVVVILVTLLGALPVYWYVAGKSPRGEGSIAMLERLVHGWRGKSLILVLLGFAATDFIMVKTISLADAAVHVLGNEYVLWQNSLEFLAERSKDSATQLVGSAVTGFFTKQLMVTLLLGVLGFVFWFLLRKGFNRNVLVLAVPLIAVYLLLNAVIIGCGLWYLANHTEVLTSWFDRIVQGDWGPQVRHETLLSPGAGLLADWGLIVLFCLLLFPRLSLGLSGFELSLILMPQVEGSPLDHPDQPLHRIRNTRKVLVIAALLMSVFLLGSVLVTNLLIPEREFALGAGGASEGVSIALQAPEGKASNRALAYLAHGGRLSTDEDSLGPLFGAVFGTVYDICTILILTLAGTSVMTALGVLLPQFLLRFGMTTLGRAQRWGLVLMLLGLVNLAVTLYFRARVTDQRGAYATAVLVLFTTASSVTALDRGKQRERAGKRIPWLLNYFTWVAVLFLASTAAVIVRAPSGLLIGGAFIVVLFLTSVLSRSLRVNELRTLGFKFKDEHSKFLWDSLRLADFPVLVPHRPGRNPRDLKEKQIRDHHQLNPDAEVVFLEMEIGDASDFTQDPLIEVFQEGRRFVIRASRCVSVAHAIAAIALEMSRYSKPPGLHFGWPDMDLMIASWSYLAFGEGNVPWRVRELIQLAEPDPAKRPRVIVG
jgi:hypothetical protein